MKNPLTALLLSAACMLAGYAAGRTHQHANDTKKAIQLATQLEDVYDWSSDEACEFAFAYYGIEK